MSKRMLAIAILALATSAFAQDAATQPDATASKKPAVKKSTPTAKTTVKSTTATKMTTAKSGTAKKPATTGAKKTTARHHATTTTTAKKRTPVKHTHPNAPTPVKGQGTTTPTGLQYWDIRVGTGATAVAGQQAEMQYSGWLPDGKEFDSSYHTGHTFPFQLGAGQVIKGWDEGVAGMKVGGMRQLRIPPQLAYGERGYPGAIPPSATLIFDVELVGVK